MTKNGHSKTAVRSYFMVDPLTHITVTAPTLKQKQRVLVDVNIYVEYAHSLTHVEESRHLIALRSKCGSVLLKQPIDSQTKSVVLNVCDYFNLFNSNEETGKKAKVSILPNPPPHATSVTISLIRSGYHSATNFTEHLKFYFDSPQVLHPGHVFCVKVPVSTPPNIPLEVWMKHVTANKSFTQPTYPVYFKVVSALAGETKLLEFFYISSERTTLYEVANTHHNIPTIVPHERVDLFYSLQIDVLRSQLSRNMFLPVVLSGEKGSCKLEVLENVAGHLRVGLYHVPGVDYCGEAAGALENKYVTLSDRISQSLPCLVYLDSLELLGRTRDGGSVDPRVVLALSQLVERVRGMWSEGKVYLVGGCCDVNSVSMQIRHLFDSFVSLPSPKADKLFQFLSNHVKLDISSDLEKDVKRKLSKMSLRKTLKVIDEFHMQLGLGLNDNQTVPPDLCNKVFGNVRLKESNESSQVPDTKWEDIGGIDHVRREIEETIEIPLKYAELFGPGVRRSGLLLHGKPGCGKTMVARAIASQCNLSFISIQGPELLNSFVGQSEDNVRKIFENARNVAPTVLFFDEIDAIAPKRSGGVIDRVLAQLLSEMDGIESSSNVFIIAATNRPELLDPAVLRPGRLDKRVEVSVGADVESRVEVFTALSRKLKLWDNVDFRTVSEMSGPLTGAECYGVLLEACYNAIQRSIQAGETEVSITFSDLISSIRSRDK